MATRKLPPISGSSPTPESIAKSWLTGEPITLGPDTPSASQTRAQNPRISSQGIDLSLYEPDQLLELRALIDTFLPVRSLKHVNMEQELVIQLLTAQKLQQDTLADEMVPANQKSQVLNAVAGALGTLAKLQVDLYDSERLKRIEACLIEAVNSMPTDAQTAFMDEYERLLGGVQ